MVVYFISSKCGNDSQSGTLECGEIKSNTDYDNVICQYKKQLNNTYGYKPEDVVIVNFNRL